MYRDARDTRTRVDFQASPWLFVKENGGTKPSGEVSSTHKYCLVSQELTFPASSYSLYSFHTNYSNFGYSVCPYRNVGNAILNQTGPVQSPSVTAARYYQTVHQTYTLGVLKVPIFVVASPTARGSVKQH